MKNTNKDKKSQHHSHKDCHEYSFQDSRKFLSDLQKSGKERPWKKNKDLSSAVLKAVLSKPGLERYGESIKNCGSSLRFANCYDHGKRLAEAYFCKCRMCTMCQWRRSLAVQKQVLDLTHSHLEERSTDVPLLLTLTVVNETGCNLNKTIDRMYAAWTKLMRRKVVDSAVTSWVRLFEISRNNERDDYHPHFHVMLMVPRQYFRKDRGLYIIRDEWLRLWQESMGDDRITQVDIRTMKKKGAVSLESLVGEVAKYATKPLSYIMKDKNGELVADPDVVEELHYALKGRRLVGFGGLFNRIRKERKLLDVEAVDLVSLENDLSKAEEGGVEKKLKCKDKDCKLQLKDELYRWDFVAKQFFLVWSSDEFRDSG